MSPAPDRYQVDEVSPVSDEALQRLLDQRAFTRHSQEGGGSAADT